MKELYISPELEILCFAPVQNLAAAYDVTLPNSRTSDGSVSTGEVDNDFSIPATDPNNPDGNL